MVVRPELIQATLVRLCLDKLKRKLKMLKRIIIKTLNDLGNIGIVCPAPEANIYEIASQLLAEGKDVEIVDTDVIPSDRTFRNAWKHCPTKKVDVCLDKAKVISHEKRRVKRAEEFAPHDEVIAKKILAKGKSLIETENEAEAARQAIRDKHAVIQNDIDGAETPEELKQILSANGII